MALSPRQLTSGLFTINLRPVLESAGPADAALAFRILVTHPEVQFSFGMGPQLAVYLEATRLFAMSGEKYYLTCLSAINNTHLATQCGIQLLPVFRALVFGLALCFGESINLT
jgi:hypothetical protein